MKDENIISSYEQRRWFLLTAGFPITSIFDDAQISLHYKLKRYDLKLRLN